MAARAVDASLRPESLILDVDGEPVANDLQRLMTGELISRRVEIGPISFAWVSGCR